MDNPKPSLLRWREIPGGVWALGFVSLFMDASSEMIHALLPLYLVGVLGASTLEVGVIEGIAEATAAVTKVFSGVISDWLGKRKWLAAAGYGLAALSKPMFPLAPNIAWVIAARFIDRVGKGIRGAPRDALIADLTPNTLRGAAYGLRQSLDTVGAFIGPGLAIAFMALLADDFRAVFWIAVIPALLSVAVIVLLRARAAPRDGEERSPRAADARRSRQARHRLLDRGRGRRRVHARPLQRSVPVAARPVGRHAAHARPLGHGGDEPGLCALGLAGRRAVGFASAATACCISGFALLIVADLVLAFSTGVVAVMVGVALWGLHMGLTQGLLSALVADTAPERLRGTAFGVFNLVSGLAMLAASIIAGALWDVIGPDGTFIAGAIFTAIALAALPFAHRWRVRRGHG